MLYIVGTPIGNLEDLSLRAARTLVSSDIILAEDTRSAHTLLNFAKETFNVPVNPTQRMISYYKEKEFEKLAEVLEYLKDDKSVCLISESGMPLISDPGYILVKEATKQNLPVSIVPGPTAVTTALALSGFNPENFMFVGYLPKKSTALKRQIDRIRQISQILDGVVFVAYESPHRVKETLKVLQEAAPEASVVVARELTKKFEEVTRGKPEELGKRDYKGEITLVLSFD